MVVPSSSKRDQTMQLIEEKNKIEQKISDYGKVLEANNVGMTGSLVDAEGFPRHDIDVHQVRQARHQIICLQNDLKDLMKRIEQGLAEVHAEAREAGTSSAKRPPPQTQKIDNVELAPIVKVNLVSPGSPAEDAGLRIGDDIIEFGSVNSKNFKNLTSIGDVVKHKENQKIPLKIKREEQILELSLTPRTWHGRGLLGCNIILTDTALIER